MLEAVDPGVERDLGAGDGVRVRDDPQPGGVRGIDDPPQRRHLELGAELVAAGREEAAARHHLDQVDAPLDAFGDGAVQLRRDGRIDGSPEEVAVAAGCGDRWPGGEHSRQALGLAPAVVQRPVVHVAEVAHRGDAGGHLAAQALGDDGVDVVHVGRARPLEAAGRTREGAGRDEVHVAVDQARQQGAGELGHGYA